MWAHGFGWSEVRSEIPLHAQESAEVKSNRGHLIGEPTACICKGSTDQRSCQDYLHAPSCRLLGKLLGQLLLLMGQGGVHGLAHRLLLRQLLLRCLLLGHRLVHGLLLVQLLL